MNRPFQLGPSPRLAPKRAASSPGTGMRSCPRSAGERRSAKIAGLRRVGAGFGRFAVGRVRILVGVDRVGTGRRRVAPALPLRRQSVALCCSCCCLRASCCCRNFSARARSAGRRQFAAPRFPRRAPPGAVPRSVSPAGRPGRPGAARRARGCRLPCAARRAGSTAAPAARRACDFSCSSSAFWSRCSAAISSSSSLAFWVVGPVSFHRGQVAAQRARSAWPAPATRSRHTAGRG